MDSAELKDKFLAKLPRYAVSKEDVINSMSDKTSSETSGNNLGPIYNSYVFAFFVGIHINKREPLPLESKLKKDFSMPMKNWRNMPEELMDYIIMTLLCEIEVDWYSLLDAEEEEIDEFIKGLRQIFEEYANGGLTYLKGRYSQNNAIFSNAYAFINILKEVAENGKTSK